MTAHYEEPVSRVLVVEDQATVGELLSVALTQEGCVVTTTATGENAIALLGVDPFDVLVLDLTLPECDGLEVLADIRRRGNGVRTLILTAPDAMSDRLEGLNLGADDYMVKPFATIEAVARVRALLRRARGRDIRRMHVGDLELDLITRQVSRAGRIIVLAPREFELLAYLMSNGGRVVSRDMLIHDLWPQLERGTHVDNVIDVHVGRLRRKVDSHAAAPLIHTIRGLGFRISTARS